MSSCTSSTRGRRVGRPTLLRRRARGHEGAAAAGAASEAQQHEGQPPAWWQRVRYRYVDDEDRRWETDRNSTTLSSEEPRDGIVGSRMASCPVTRWVGGADRQRTSDTRIDLSAGPVAYGPALSGDGVVTEHTLPSVLSLVRRFSDSDELSRHLAVEVAALCARTAKLLLAPPVAWLPDRFYAATTVVAVLISDLHTAAVGGGATTAEARAKEAREWDGLMQTLRDQLEPLALAGSAVHVRSLKTSLSECVLCAAALAGATTTVASAPPPVRALTHEARRVDGAQLVRFLNATGARGALSALGEAGDAALRAASAEAVGAGSDFLRLHHRVLPLFVYSLAGSAAVAGRCCLTMGAWSRRTATSCGGAHAPTGGRRLRWHRRRREGRRRRRRPPPPAATDDDGGGVPVRLANTCDGNALWLDASRIERPCSRPPSKRAGASCRPTTVRGPPRPPEGPPWAARRTRLGRTPPVRSLFVERDAAARATLHALAAAALREARSLGGFFHAYGKAVDDVLTPQEHLAFLRRLNVLRYKLERARAYMSLHNFRVAQHYLLSTWHDLGAMRAVLDAAAKPLQASLLCDM